MSVLATDLSPRYLVAKHVPDIRRFEPRNIGVILWTPDGFSARFLGEDTRGHFDGRKRPSFVRDSQMYGEWIRFWRYYVSHPSELSAYTGNQVDPGNPSIVEVLKEAAQPSFPLVEGGRLLDAVSFEQRPAVLKQIYQLVVDETELVDEKITIEQAVQAARNEYQLERSPHWRDDYELKLSSAKAPIIFDHAFIGKKVERLWQRWPVMPNRKLMEQVACSVAFKFEQASKLKITKSNLGALVAFSKSEEKRWKKLEELVGGYAPIYNLNSRQDRKSAFGSLPRLDHLEGTEIGSLA
jgi:hypothetical protein